LILIELVLVWIELQKRVWGLDLILDWFHVRICLKKEESKATYKFAATTSFLNPY